MNIANDHTEAFDGAVPPIDPNTKIEVITNSKDKKEFLVIKSAVKISQEVDAEIAERAKTFKLAGFKDKGVPASIVKRQIGKAVMTQHIDTLIRNAVLQVVKENDLSFAIKPNIEIKEFDPEGDIKIFIISTINLLRLLIDVTFVIISELATLPFFLFRISINLGFLDTKL